MNKVIVNKYYNQIVKQKDTDHSGYVVMTIDGRIKIKVVVNIILENETTPQAALIFHLDKVPNWFYYSKTISLDEAIEALKEIRLDPCEGIFNLMDKEEKHLVNNKQILEKNIKYKEYKVFLEENVIDVRKFNDKAFITEASGTGETIGITRSRFIYGAIPNEYGDSDYIKLVKECLRC
jgi:hypothetical protein